MATWAKSSQYRGMPHQQYMQTEEGQKAGQFFREDAQRMREGRNTPQRTGFATGRAQPMQSPYANSTPYQKNPSGDFAAYAPADDMMRTGGGSASDPRWSNNGGQWQSPGMGQQSPAQQSPAGGFGSYAPQTKTYGTAPSSQLMSAWTMPKQDLLGWAQTQDNASFYQQGEGGRWQPGRVAESQYTPTAGPSPTDTWNRNFAVIDQINNQAANQQVGTYLGQGAPPPGWGQTNYNPQQMLATANQMNSQGWQSPLLQSMMPQLSQPGYGAQDGTLGAASSQAFPSQYQAGGWMESAGPPSPELFTGNEPASSSPAPKPASRPPGAPSAGIRARGPGDPPERGRNAGQTPLRSQPGASQMVGGRVQSTGATGYGFGSGQGSGSPGAIGFLNRIEGQAEPSRPAMSLADRPSNPAARKSWDARYAAQNKNNPDGTPKSHYELNKDGAYKGMTEEEAARQKFVGDSRASAYNNNANFRAMVDENRRERMTPTMWASMQNETVENGVRRKGGFMRQADIDAQSQWLAARGQTGVPDGSRLDENKLYEDYLASTGTSVEERMAADRQANAAREAERAALPPTYLQQQVDERARRAQSQEDIIRQFQQERGFDPREMMKRGGRGDRSPIYI